MADPLVSFSPGFGSPAPTSTPATSSADVFTPDPTFVPPARYAPSTTVATIDRATSEKTIDQSRDETRVALNTASNAVLNYKAKLEDRGYVLRDGRWGTLEGGDSEYAFVNGQWTTVPGSGSKFVPISASDPDVANYTAAVRDQALLKEKYDLFVDLDTANARNGGDSGSGGSGGGGGGGGSSAKVLTPLDIEGMKADEVDRQEEDATGRIKDLFSLLGAAQNMAIDAQAANQQSNALSAKGTNYGWEIGGHFVPGLEDKYQKMIDMLSASVPEEIPPIFRLNGILGIPGNTEGFNDADYPNLPRFAGGTGQSGADLDAQRIKDIQAHYQSKYGVTIPLQTAAQIMSSGASLDAPQVLQIVYGYDTKTGKPSATATPGSQNSNATTPVSGQQYGGQDYDAQLLSIMLDNIKNGRAGMPAWYTGPDLSQFSGSGKAIPNETIAMLAQLIRQNPNAPELVALMGGQQRPADRPDAYLPGDTPDPTAGTPLTPSQVNSILAGLGTSQSTGGGGGDSSGGLRTMYAGSYQGSGGASAAEQAQIDYNNRRLDLEKLIADRSWELDNKKFDSDESYRAAQLELARAENALKDLQFQETLRRAKWEEEQTGKEFDLKKIAQEFDQQWKLREEARAEKQIGLQRAKTFAEFNADKGDLIARDLFGRGSAEAVGTGINILTGEALGPMTYSQADAQDADTFLQSLTAPKMMANGGPFTGMLAILGDSAKSNKATGNEEVIVNHTNAPIDIIPNKLAVALGLVPPKNKPHKGVA